MIGSTAITSAKPMQILNTFRCFGFLSNWCKFTPIITQLVVATVAATVLINTITVS